MSSDAYYRLWLKVKDKLKITLAEDFRLQELAKANIGIKPQSTAVEVVARVYCRYCELFNQLCECYDQMAQVQRRPYLKKIIEAVTCRLQELKRTLEDIESIEFTYPDNSLQQLVMIPSEIEILCPFFYPFEIRQQEMQYIIDQVMTGNRIGDPLPTPSELELREQQRLEEEERLREEKEAEVKRLLAMGEEVPVSEASVIYSPQELEEMRLRQEYETHLFNIQRMERSRCVTRAQIKKFNQDANLFLELSGSKAPPPRDDVAPRACALIQNVYRRFMLLKREKNRERRLKEKLGMVMSAWQPPSAKTQLEIVKESRREFRRKYYEKWMAANLKENTRVLRLREGDIMEDISTEVRQWFWDWYKKVRVFDEYPWPDEGGSILVVQGNTFTIPEYIEWEKVEGKRLKAEAASPKSKEDIKAEKIAAREEKRRQAADAKIREKKMLEDYKKQRLNPKNDPGVFIKKGNNIESVIEAWVNYENQWQYIDMPGASKEVFKGYLMELVTENAYQDVQLKLRPVVDEMMREELNLLRNALKIDYAHAQATIPITQKRKKPKKIKVLKPEKVSPAAMLQCLLDNGIVKKCPEKTLDNFLGDRNYAAADTRAIAWVPKFPPPGMGDVREQVRVRCLLTLGSSCKDAERCQLLIGPKSAGKKTLIYAVAHETNSVLIDLSPFNVYNKFPGKELKKLFLYVNKISRLMQPTVIMVDGVDKLFYKKVPPEEKELDPTRLQKDFFKEIVKSIGPDNKILVLGTATEPWLARTPAMLKCFPTFILFPRSDYGSISLILTQKLMKFHGVDRGFNVQSVAQAARGYDLKSVIKGIEAAVSTNRVPQLYSKPLQESEVLRAILDSEDSVCTDPADLELFKEWFMKSTPFGEKYTYLMFMIDTQYQFKLKEDKKKKGGGGG